MSSSTAVTIVGVSAVVQVRGITAQPTDPWVTIKNSKYTLKMMTKIADSENVVDGIVRGAGLNDFTFNFEGTTDISQPGTSTIENQVFAGQILDFRAFRSYSYNATTNTLNTGSLFWTGRMIVENFEGSTGTGDNDEWKVEAKKQSGKLTFPDGVTQF